MKKEELIKLGLDKDLADKVAEASAEELKSFIPKHRFDEVNTAKKEHEEQVKTYQAEVEKLTKNASGTEELQKQLATLKDDYSKKETDYQNKVKQISEDSALKLAFGSKVHDVDYAISQIDRSKLEFDDNGNITKGLEEQEKALQESKPFVFKQQEQQKKQQQQPGIRKLGAGKQSTEAEEPSLQDAIADRFKIN